MIVDPRSSVRSRIRGGETDVAIPVIDPADEATRYLASAVHLDDDLADVLVEEYLAEPKRSIPPSPGVRAEPVLREAAAAQARRRMTSVGLLLLLFGMLVTSALLVFGWLASAIAWRLGALVVARLARPKSGERVWLVYRWQRWCLTAGLWLVLNSVTIALITLPFVLLAVAAENFGSDSQSWSSGSDVAAYYMLAILLSLVMFSLLAAQAYLRRRTVDGWFGYGIYQPNAAPRNFVSWACGPYAARLERIAADESRRAQTPNASEIVVYRGHKPFVGAGVRVQNWSIALPLLTAGDNGKDAAVPVFSPAELQDFVAAELESLRTPQTLTPGWRFSGLEMVHWATLSARHMMHYPAAGPLLGQLDSGTNPTLTVKDWVGLIDSSPEWLRYLRCYRVEAWERQLAVSGYLHVGCDNRTLVLEWNAYVLPPVAQQYRMVDEPPRVPELRALWQAACELAVLPVTVPARIADLVRGVRDMAGIGKGRWRTPLQASRVFGAVASLREVAAGDEFTNFFEESDCDRYLKILDRRIFDAVHRFLETKGLSTGTFDGLVAQINNSTVLNNCNVIAGNVGGQGNVGTVGPGSAGPGK
ncbi:hypothetical protein ACFQZZ_15055 [Nocardia sp. GCM10030253]|uniref:hypothetical protein n=1 Tax=Nocardia sp. GCM10030253 TaxID=3273404 RepID=UPI003642F216